ncbi:UDP-N-acetylmuramoyl-L-alanine--D-glutamate ligase [Sneathiella sp.]|uniref:UDP-N-acetylmuramoyl-L-alanine--D-glutamate ligase n=1 Tax=Sneathiella sp. TaxID=1964365 RepID=UPI00356845A8
MMESHSYQDKTIAVFGLGKSGMSTARRLQDGKAHVFVWDDNEGRRRTASEHGLTLKDLLGERWQPTEALVLSPGVPLTHPAPHAIVDAAKSAGTKIIGDVEIFLQEKTAGRLIGITGTNGKSTTTALISHLLSSAGRPVAAGGNIGTPVMDLPQLDEDGTYVLELSSYQLDLTPSWQADIAILLNITPDHLDRHGDLSGYADVKRRIFQKQTEKGVAVLNQDDPLCRQIADDLRRESKTHIILISTIQAAEGGVSVIDGLLKDQSRGDQPWTVDISDIASLRGRHNWQNAAAAVAAVSSMGLEPDEIRRGLTSFGGLAHRMEPVGSLGPVSFVNDSKATNAEAAEKALTSFENIYWIAGGREKAGGITSLSPHFGRIAHAFLIGEAKDNFAATLTGHISFTICDTLAEATEKAANAAFRSRDKSAVVLLSPAAASFDQFTSFEARGDAFREIVARLIAEAS